jgi:hypothetical protein
MQLSTRAPILDDELLGSIKATYRVLRLGLGSTAIALPLTLWLVGLVRGVPLQGSMSEYYNTDMRDVFVGVLFAAGAGLFLYRGFSRIEDWVLNLAGLFGIGVAIFPVRADAGDLTLHGTCAVLFFVCLAYVAVFRATDTLTLVTDAKRVKRYKSIYRSLGIAMLALPAIAAILVSAFEFDRAEGETKRVVFFVEFAAIWAFGAFWLVKSHEIRRTQKDQESHPESSVRQLA